MTRLHPTRPEHHAALTAYRLPAAQHQFTALPQEWLDRPLPAAAHAVTILHQNEAVGFFILDGGTDRAIYSDNPHALLLRSMSVNPAFQQQGIATAAFRELPAFVRQYLPDCHTIVLGVNEKNLSALNFYRKNGFRDTGRTRTGQRGIQHILEKTL